MKLTLEASHLEAPHKTFTLPQLHLWVEVNKPQQIEMTDKQYSWYAHMCGVNRSHYSNIPIVFV